jgi:phospholipase/carboxylesterase
MPRPLDGPRLAPASGTARQLVVFVHGYGADGNDLIALGQVLQPVFPDAAFVSPHAPEDCPANPFGGRQWFALTLRDDREIGAGLAQAGPDLDAFLDAELERHGLGPEALALVGFSQGTMMALHVGLGRAAPPAAIVGYSGVLMALPRAAGAQDFPPVLLVHGKQDEVIPSQALTITRQMLETAGVPVEAHLREGLGHGIDEEGLRLGAGFLARHLAG